MEYSSTFRDLIEVYNNEPVLLDKLVVLYDSCDLVDDSKGYPIPLFEEMINYFLEIQNPHPSETKTVLIITKPYRNVDGIKGLRDALVKRHDELINQI